MSEKYIEHLGNERNDVKKVLFACSFPRDNIKWGIYFQQIMELDEYLMIAKREWKRNQNT